MRIAVLADTHAGSLSELPREILPALNDVDLIIHAGDFTGRDVLEGLQRLGSVAAVHGNMDSDELKRLLPQTKLLYFAGQRIGIIHGWGSPDGIEGRVGQLLPDADIIVFGHSHRPQNRIINGTLFFNPGPARKSYGILTLGEQASGEIIELG